MAEWSLQDKVVFITGAAGGIGSETAGELTRRGARCVLADLDMESLKRTAGVIGGDPLTLELDVTDLAGCERAVAEAVDRHGRLDAVWANAGIATFGPLLHTEPAAWRRTIDVNLVGAFHTVRAALPSVIAQKGYVAVTASLATYAHAPGMSAYAATKAGVEAMCNALRIEVAHLGVDVATIHPTWIATRMVTDLDDEVRAWARLRKAMNPPFRKTYPPQRAAQDIARGFERRASRICSPGFVRVAHVLRPALTTRAFDWNLRAAAPEIERLFVEQAAQGGAERASTTDRVRPQAEASDPG
jgi:NAD(P)-dependent dehydrogenase (short-subunit alcohol dehydrogenase family)